VTESIAFKEVAEWNDALLSLNTGFPWILENNKFILQVLEMSLNLAKSGNVLEKILPVKIST